MITNINRSQYRFKVQSWVGKPTIPQLGFTSSIVDYCMTGAISRPWLMNFIHYQNCHRQQRLHVDYNHADIWWWHKDYDIIIHFDCGEQNSKMKKKLNSHYWAKVWLFFFSFFVVLPHESWAGCFAAVSFSSAGWRIRIRIGEGVAWIAHSHKQ